MPKPTTPDYQRLTTELETLLANLEQGDITIDEAVEAYERGVVIIGLLDDRLKHAENKVTQLKVKLENTLE